jgi:hypothetical protein
MSETERSLEMRKASMPVTALEYVSPEGRQVLMDLEQAVRQESPEGRNI